MKKLIIVLGMLLVAQNGYSQVRIDTVIVNIAANPSTARVKLTTSDFILKGITLSSLNDTNNTQVVSIFYKMPPNCGQVLISKYWDTTYQIIANFPFDLKIYGVIDTSINCPQYPTTPLYLDSFFLSATQIIVLPISFTYINAEAINKKILIKWGVAQQENTDKYIVERANKEQRFWEQAQAQPTALLQYQYTDEKPLAEDSYYRIKAVNKDGNLFIVKPFL